MGYFGRLNPAAGRQAHVERIERRAPKEPCRRAGFVLGVYFLLRAAVAVRDTPGGDAKDHLDRVSREIADHEKQA